MQPADNLDPDSLRHQLVGMLPDCPVDQPKQTGHLVVRPTPVLAAEDVERQHLDPLVRGDQHDRANGLDSLHVPG